MVRQYQTVAWIAAQSKKTDNNLLNLIFRFDNGIIFATYSHVIEREREREREKRRERERERERECAAKIISYLKLMNLN